MDEWPAELAFLRDLEELMKCPICFDLMQAPVMLPSCEHNYCSFCIRRYFCQREQCPTCGSLASSNQLRSNGIMEKTIEQFKKIRSPLRSLCVNRLLETPTSSQSGDSSKSQEVQEDKNTLCSEKSPSFCRTRRKPNRVQVNKDGPVTTSRSRKRQASQSSSDSEDSDIQIISEDENCSFTNSKFSSSASKAQQCVLPPSFSSNQTKGMKPRNVQSKLFVSGDGSKTCTKENLGTKGELTTSRSVKSAEVSPKVASPLAMSLTKSAAAVNSLPKVLSVLMTSQNKKDVNIGDGSREAGKVPCPVCGVPVITSFVNRHLDLCLGQQEKQAAQKEKRKPLPKLVYNLMSEKDIRKRLKDLGLTCKGDRQALIKRHHEFTMYHNADCDSIAPKDLNELVKDFEDMQNMQAKQSTRSPSSSHSILRFTKDSKQEDIEKARKDYVACHKDQFQSLIKETRKRMKSAQKPLSSTSSSSAGSTPDSGAQEYTQGQSASSVTLDTAVHKGKGSHVSDDGDEVDGEIASTSEARTIAQTQDTRCSVSKSDDDITCAEEIVEYETAISETQNSADERSVLGGDVVVSKDPHKDTVLCSSQLQTASAELGDEAVPKPDLVRENTDSEENDVDVFESGPKYQCVQSSFKSPIRGRGKRALRSSQPSWQDTDCEGPSSSPCGSQVSGGSKHKQRKPSCKILPSESVDEENSSPGGTRLKNSSDGLCGLPDAQKLLDPPGSDIPPELTGQHQATSTMQSCGKGTEGEVCSAKDGSFTELPGKCSENLDAGIMKADSMATNHSVDRETDSHSIQKTANQSQPEAAVNQTHRMQEIRGSGTRTHEEQRNTVNLENENHTEESVKSLHLLTATSEVEEDGNETSDSGEANHLHGLLADPSLSDGGENKRPSVSDNRDNRSGPRTARDCLSENENVCFEVDLSDCEDEELLPVMKETDSVSLKSFTCPQNAHGEKLRNTCESDLKKSTGTPCDVGASRLDEDNPHNAKETNLISAVHEVDQETNFSAKAFQVATLKSVLRKKLDKDSLLKKSVRFAGLRARISDIENEGHEHKLAKERSDGGKHKGEISFVGAAVSRDEAVFLADLRKMGSQDKTGDLKKGDYLENGDCVSVETKEDGVSLEDEEEGLSVEDQEEGVSLENGGEDVSLKDKEEGISLESRGEGMSQEDKEEDMSTESRGEGMSLEYRGEGISLESKGNRMSVKDKGEHVSMETSAVCEVNECTVAAETTLCSQKQNKKIERSGVKEKRQRNRKTSAVDTTIESITTEISEHSCETAAGDLRGAKDEIHRGYGKKISKGKKKKHSALPTIPEDFTSLKELNEEHNSAQSVSKNRGGVTCVMAQAVTTESESGVTECDYEKNSPHTSSAFPDVHSSNAAEEEVQIPEHSLTQNRGSDTISGQPPRLNRTSYPSALHVSQTASECSSGFEKPKDVNVSNSKHRRKRANSSADKYDGQTATSESCIQVKTVGTGHKRRRTRQSGDSMTLHPIPEVCLEPQNNTMSTLQTVPEMDSEIEKPLENTERQSRTEHKTRKGSSNIEKRSRTDRKSQKQRSGRCAGDTPAQTQQAVPVEDQQGEKTEKGRTRKRKLCEVSTSEGKGSE